MNPQTAMPKLLLWGAGAHGRVIHDLAWACGYRDLAFVDDRPGAEFVCGSPVLLPDDERIGDYIPESKGKKLAATVIERLSGFGSNTATDLLVWH